MTNTGKPTPVTFEDVQALRGDIKGLRDDAAWLRKGFYGNRWRIRLIILSLVLDVLLTAGVTFSAVGANNACNQANQSRAAQRQLWGYILFLNPPQTPQQAQTNKQFRAFINYQFRPRDCSVLSSL